MTQENIQKLQIEYHNIKRMYEIQKETNINLKNKVKTLQNTNKELEERLNASLEVIEKI